MAKVRLGRFKLRSLHDNSFKFVQSVQGVAGRVITWTAGRARAGRARVAARRGCPWRTAAAGSCGIAPRSLGPLWTAQQTRRRAP